jgi:serine/threonine-protein kinase
MSTLLNAESIEGKYEIIERMAEGGMGAVYKVRHLVLEEIRVIKVTKSKFQESDELKERFLREARLAVRMKHQNIAQIYDCTIEKDGSAYLVMEYIRGVNLDELVEETGLPDLRLALEIADQSLRALHYLHRKDIVHRDISPDNLMLTQDDHGGPLIKLIDLGIAKAVESEQSLTEAGSFLGKVAYASPEHFSASTDNIKIDARCDVYSFGIVLYQLLTGKHPIRGKDFKSLLAGHLMRPPVPFDESDPGGRIPEGLRQVILKSLEKDREDRFASAEDFRTAIKAVPIDFGDSPTIAFDLNKSLQALDLRKVQPVKPAGDSTQDRIAQAFPSGPTPPPTPPTDVETAGDSGHPPIATGSIPDWKLELNSLLEKAEDLLRMDQPDLARAQIEAVLRIQPTEERALSMLERVVAQQAGTAPPGPGDVDATQVLDFKAAEEESAEAPGVAEAAALTGEARALVQAGDCAAAIAKLEKARELDPTSADVETELDRARESLRRHQEEQERLGRIEDAAKEIEGLIAKDALDDAASRLQQAITDLGEVEPLQELGKRIADKQEQEKLRRIEEAAKEVEVLIAKDALDDAATRLQQAITDLGEVEPLQELGKRIADKQEQEKLRRIAELLDEGRRLSADGEHDAAIAKLGEAIELDPKNAVVEKQLAAAREAQRQSMEEQELLDRIDKAAANVEKLIAADKLDKASKSLAKALREYGEAAPLKQLERRISEVETERREQQITGLVTEGRKLLADGRHEPAIAKLEQAHELDPSNTDLTNELEAAREAHREHQEQRRQEQQLAEAVQGVENLIARGDLEKASSGLATAIKQHGKVTQLRALQQRIVDVERQQREDRVSALVAEGRKLSGKGEYDAAISKLEQAHELDPSNADVTKQLEAARAAVAEPTLPPDGPDAVVAQAAEDTAAVAAAEPAPAKAPTPAAAEAAPIPAREVPAAARPRGLRSPIVIGGVVAAGLVVIIGIVLIVRSLGGPTTDTDTSVRPDDRVAAAAAPIGGLAINALPWARVVEVVDENGVAQELPSDSHTPMFLDLPAGSYRVSLRPPDGGAAVQVEAEVRDSETTKIIERLQVADVDEFLEGFGFSR